jgi:hypothetical protein
MHADEGQVTVRAAVHALDAALAEHRRALALAASRREQERMARAREVKAAAAAGDAALEQPVERPMRSVRLAETWIEVDRARHPLTAAVRAAVEAGELRVRGADWSARIALAPGEAPAAAARDAAERITVAAAAVADRGRERLERVIAVGVRHSAACYAAAATLDAADRELLERHADHARIESCAAELAKRLGARRAGESAEVAAARDRLEHARAHLAAAPPQPYAWTRDLAPSIAGAALRDLPEDALEAARPALARLPAEPGALLALAAVTPDRRAAAVEAIAAQCAGAAVAAVTEAEVIVVTAAGAERHAAQQAAADGDRLLVAGREVARGLAESRPGRLGVVLELLRRI